ncbi:MAG: glutaredoxin family protein [Desulfamplus sp.]|nr:glutaredoxin family protein [Desulfamplus sp.]
MNKNSTLVYALSTCSHCKAARKFLTECDVQFSCVEVDSLTGEERHKTIADIKKINPRCSFPTIVINDKVIVGFQANEIKEALGLETD